MSERTTLVEFLGTLGRGRQLDVDKVNLELLVSLDTDEDRRATSADNELIGIVRRLEDESESALELLDDRLDQAGEGRDTTAVGRLAVEEVLGEDGGDFGIGVRVESVASLFEDQSELLVVRDNAVVNDGELVISVAAVRMAATASAEAWCESRVRRASWSARVRRA